MTGHLGAAASRAVDAALEATVLPSFSRVGYQARRRLFRWQQPVPGSMAGEVVIVTGATGGLGAAIATALARLGATVWLLGRDRDRTAAVAERIRGDVPGADLRVAVADLGRLCDVREVADTLLAETERLDVLVHNAGTLTKGYQSTVDGLELTAAVQVVAPFLLTTLLLPRLAATPGSRVITVSSGGMYTRRLDVDALTPDPASFNGVAAYASAKRAQVVLTQEWARRTRGSGSQDPSREVSRGVTGVAFHSTHPGWVDTPGLRSSLPRFAGGMGPLLRSPADGVDTIVWLASCPAGEAGTGQFWHDRRPRSTVRLPRTATPPGEAGRLWEWTATHAGVSSTLRVGP